MLIARIAGFKVGLRSLPDRKLGSQFNLSQRTRPLCPLRPLSEAFPALASEEIELDPLPPKA